MTEAQHRLAPEEPNDDPSEAKMGFLDHLDELRKRIIRSVLPETPWVTRDPAGS